MRAATRPIPLSSPYLDEREEELVVEVLRSGRLSLGPLVDNFEERFAERVGAPYAAAVSSGTAGLHLLCRLAGLGPGDEVITSPYSFAASANCFLYEGATPVFADVDPRTLNLDPAAVEAAITERTRAVVAVDIFGYPCELDPLRELCERHGLALVEDACEALGAAYRGRPIGSHGPDAVFAFYPNKQITTGEGGIVTTHSEQRRRLLRSLRNQGRADDGGWLEHARLGYNYRLSDVAAAIGIGQLDKLDRILELRGEAAARYAELLAGIAGIEPPLADDTDHRRSWFVYVVKLERGIDRERVIGELDRRRIGTARYLPCIHLQPYMRERYGFREGLCPAAEDVSRRTLALPFHTALPLEDQEHVVEVLAAALDRAVVPQPSKRVVSGGFAPPAVAASFASESASEVESLDYDLFISHASEDKDRFVRPLVEELEARGLRVWFDETQLEVGDSLIEKIESGLRRSRFCALILSPAFFGKRWTRAELNSLSTREFGTGQTVLLPIWLDVREADVRQHAPLLTDRFALRAGTGLQAVAVKLVERVVGETPARAPASLSAPTSVTRAASERELDAMLLRGRIYPYSYSPVVRSDEHALVARVALAARAPTAPEPTFGSYEQRAFQDAVMASRLEELLGNMARDESGTRSRHPWRRVDPTRSWILTLARQTEYLAAGGWVTDAHAAISLKPTVAVGPPGWLIINLDVVIRPAEHNSLRESQPSPLSLEDTYGLLYMPLTALLDDIAPRILPLIDPKRPPALLAVGCLLIPNGAALGRYLHLGLYARGRAEGAMDASGIEWYAQSLDEIERAEVRAATVRQRLETLFSDGGYSDFEPAIQQLGLAQPVHSGNG